MVLNFGPPLVDFAPLGRLGESYDRGVKRDRQAAIDTARENALATFGQNSDLAALGQTLLRAGDLEGGLQALRQHAALEGSPFQRSRAAAEDAAREQAHQDLQAERERNEDYRRRQETRSDRPERFTQEGTDPDTGMPTLREGWRMPDGSVKWSDGKVSAPPSGPRSGGPGDPNLPATGGVPARGPGGEPSPAGEVGYVIPGTLQGFPAGTVRLPKTEAATLAPPAGRAAIAAPPVADAPALTATPAQAQIVGPVAPQAPAVAAAKPATVPRRANRAAPLEPDTVPFVRWPPPFVDVKEWVTAETKRLQNLAGGEGQTTDMKNKLARARMMAPQIVEELDALNKDVKDFGSEWLPTEAKARMQTTYMNLIMQLKEMYGLGALQKGDMEAVQDILSNPATPWWNPIGNVNQVATTNEQVKKIKQIVAKGLKAAEGSLGGDVNRDPGLPDLRVNALPTEFDRHGNPIK